MTVFGERDRQTYLTTTTIPIFYSKVTLAPLDDSVR